MGFIGTLCNWKPPKSRLLDPLCDSQFPVSANTQDEPAETALCALREFTNIVIQLLVA